MSAAHGHAKRSLGQNFLVDPNQQRRIVAAVEPGPRTVVLEIGPGRGALTELLAAAAGRLLLVELDDALADALESRYHDRADVRVIHDDALEAPLEEFTGRALAELAGAGQSLPNLRVVGNIPYNITSPLIFRLLEPELAPERIVLMVQKEVAERLAASPGTGAYGALTVGVRTVASVERLFHVGRGAFRPVPGVDSAVVRLVPHDPPLLTAAERRDVRVLTRAAFGRRRKQLQKTLRSAPEMALERAEAVAVLDRAGVAAEARPETLAPETFIELARALRGRGRPLEGGSL
ncbi:MAG: 16S rRNA (adenine(1518)-N(6)/adenine(1519)-N(6))-dimethyltransferase RsmA [Gemmatimonadota bacterium]